MRASRSLVSAAALAALALASALPAAAAHRKRRPAPPHVALSAKHWTTIHLPATPLGIAAHGKDLWVCGWDEMIAESQDGGRTWRIRHFDREGDLLFTFAFAPPHHVYAFGAVDEGLASDDGGKAWGNLGRPAFAVTQAFFAGPNHDLLVGPRGFAFGSPADWHGHTGRHLNSIGSAALLDASHSVLLANIAGAPPHGAGAAGAGTQFFHVNGQGRSRPEPSLIWLWYTVDGGRHWPSFRFTQMKAEFVAVANGRYWLVASGQKGRPVLLTSTDGAAWGRVVGIRRTGGYCNSQGCRESLGWRPFADISSFTQPWVYTAPRERRILVQWAAVPGAICDVGGTLRCALTGPRKPDPPARNSASGDLSLRRPTCARCPRPHYPRPPQRAPVWGTVLLEVEISRNGDVSQEALVAAPDAILASAAEKAARRWRFHPARKGGRLINSVADIQMNFRLR